LVAWQVGIFSPGSTNSPTPEPVASPVRVQSPARPTASLSPPARTEPVVDRGFANPAARCDGPEQMVAAGRTASSLVVICKEPNGHLLYKGVRLALGLGVQLDHVTVAAGTYVARNETATYTLSPTALVIASAAAPVSREPVVEFRTPQAAPPAAVTPKPALAAPAPTPPAAIPPPPPPAAVAPKPAPPAPLPAAIPPPPVAVASAPAPVVPSRQPQPESLASPPIEQNGIGQGQLKFTAVEPWRLHYSMTCPAGTPVGGFIGVNGSIGTVYYVELHGSASSPEAASGMSLTKSATGPVTVAVNPGDPRCTWTVSVDNRADGPSAG
jgi:hypothetical protein